MKNVIFLLSKDCMVCESLPLYGNKYWKTPNIDELASKGTIFKRHYTAAPSTSMAMSAMLSGHYLYEFKNRGIYKNVLLSEFPSVFDTLQQRGYECHLIWDMTWMNLAWRFVREFGDEEKTIIHNLDIAQTTENPNEKHPIVRNNALLEKTLHQIYETLDSIDLSKNLFIWMHLPHILKGRCSWMDDMDVFDDIVGKVRRLVGDDSIFITTDHGHMNWHKGILGYGFHLYEPSVHIPLITPRIDNLEYVEHLTCCIDLPTILTERRIIKRDYVVSETAYYAQRHRKTAIITDCFKYIYNKKDNSEELYDLSWDPEELNNILLKDLYDKDRNKHFICCEHYFYPYKDEALRALESLRSIRESFWREAPWWYVMYGVVREKLVLFRNKIKRLFKQ